MSKKDKKDVRRDTRRVLCISSLVVIILVGVMIFSPFASQYNDRSLSRGVANEWEIDSLVKSKEYTGALNIVDSLITNKKQDLPRYAYFDRFLSEKERYETNILRAEIYDLQWRRIEILKAKNDMKTLKRALEDYCGIIGYNQQQAKALLKQINDK